MKNKNCVASISKKHIFTREKSMKAAITQDTEMAKFKNKHSLFEKDFIIKYAYIKERQKYNKK